MYLIQKWDLYKRDRRVNGRPIGGRWVKYAEVKSKRAAVRAIHRLQCGGYDRDVSIYVEKLTPTLPSK